MAARRTTRPVHTLAALLRGVASVESRYQDVAVAGLALDSRGVEPGYVFLACQGLHAHGLTFAAEAIQRGAAAIVYEAVDGLQPLPADIPVIAVPGLGQRVGEIADRFFEHPSRAMTVIGITGTDGKSSISHFLAQALDLERARCGVIGTLGYGLYGELESGTHTTPDAVRVHHELRRFVDRGARWTSMEVSSHALEQGRVSGVDFDIALLSNLTRDHLDYHGSHAAYADAKRRLFHWPGLRHAVLNLDDAFGRALYSELDGQVDRVGYGLEASAGDNAVRAVDILYGPQGVSGRVETPWGTGEFQAPLLGRFNVYNLLAVLSTLLALGVELNDALERLSHTRSIPGRMEAFGGGAGQPLVVVDYAHTPGALAAVLESLRPLAEGRLICVFGCGGDRDRGKRAEMGAVAA
ncbi:MAG: UDP-N-acetylmuramoyl-L-alanyl-D-glutamate--2,6-diaminopimelate ligase, partial [Gammaproteobacteria bacterium]